jgi:ATPase family associated with various cellular activities (AAA)
MFSLSSTFLAISGILFASHDFLLHLFYTFLKYLGIYRFEITTNEKAKEVIRLIEGNCWFSSRFYLNGTFRPSGYFFSKKAAGYIHMTSYGDISVLLFCGKEGEEFFLNAPPLELGGGSAEPELEGTAELSKSDDDETKLIYILTRYGNYEMMYYKSLPFRCNSLKAYGEQELALQKIVRMYKKKQRGVVFISGVSGAGKSMVGLLVAKELNGVYCHTFNPTTPGDSIVDIKNNAMDKDCPAVVVIEEINILIRAIHEGIPPNKKFTALVENKSTYNTFIDDLLFYQKMIVIFTSNEPKEAIDAIDPSYLRQGRVDMYIEMNTPLPQSVLLHENL